MEKRLLLIVVWVCRALWAPAQDSARGHWWVPHQVKVQYAGGIGFFSAAAGYHNKKNKLEGDLYYGYVPKGVGGVEMHILTGKLTWHLLKQTKVGALDARPLSLGTWASYTFGKQYFLFSPENYPLSYYKYPTALHIGGFVGGTLSKVVKGRRLGLYYELGSNDVEIISYINNTDALSLYDILNLALGIKVAL